MAYVKGRRFEYEVKAYLEALGYTVFRFAGSKPLDLLALRNGKILFCECKVSPKPINKDYIGEWANKLGFPVALCQKLEGSLRIEVFEPRARRPWKNTYELLEDFVNFLLENYSQTFPNDDAWVNLSQLDVSKAIWKFLFVQGG